MKATKQPTPRINANDLKSYNSMREEVRHGVSPLPNDAQLYQNIKLPWHTAKPAHLKPNTQIGGPRPKRG